MLVFKVELRRVEARLGRPRIVSLPLIGAGAEGRDVLEIEAAAALQILLEERRFDGLAIGSPVAEPKSSAPKLDRVARHPAAVVPGAEHHEDLVLRCRAASARRTPPACPTCLPGPRSRRPRASALRPWSSGSRPPCPARTSCRSAASETPWPWADSLIFAAAAAPAKFTWLRKKSYGILLRC